MLDSLYIHIPFCSAKCSYCSFNSYSGLERLQSRYIDSLLLEMEQIASVGKIAPLKTIFTGGGTPSVLDRKLLQRLFAAIESFFSFDTDVEISMEINPDSLDYSKLDAIIEAGVNRISFGVQSFNDAELTAIGRIHTSRVARDAIAMARNAGCENLSLDLMYGLPGQTPESWQKSLEEACALGVNHLSLYQLTVEEGTPFYRMAADGRLLLPLEEEVEAMDGVTARITEGEKLNQYEISNYARNGFQCRHNIGYWRNRPYIGLGAGAVSYREGCRIRNVADPVRYCELLESGESLAIERETLGSEDSFRESVIMGLRMNEGISVEDLWRRYGMNLEKYYGEVLQRLIRGRLLELRGEFLRLTERGRMVANGVMAELV